MIARTYEPDEVRGFLQTACMAAGGPAEWAALYGWPVRQVRDVLSGKRLMPAGYYPLLGLERRAVVVRAKAK